MKIKIRLNSYQYLELQAGRLFIQNSGGSSKTPFKHRDFEPYAVDCWEEHWLPVGAIGGFVTASPFGSMNVKTLPPEGQSGERLEIAVSPAKDYRGTLEILDGETSLKSLTVTLRALEPYRTTVPLDGPVEKLVVRLGDDLLVYERGADDTLSRPTAAPEAFDDSSAYGKYVGGCEAMRQKNYALAKRLFGESLDRDAHFAPAATRLAELANMQGDWREACDYCRRALAVDTYDADANYQFALASLALERYADAREGASLMSLSPGHRALALATEARVDLVRKKYASAIRLAEKAREFAGPAPEPLRILACAHRAAGQEDDAKKIVELMKQINPLDHFADAELFLLGRSMPRGLPNLQTELPRETYLELAAWYCNAGRGADAAALLELSASLPGRPHVETLIWLAWLKQDEKQLERAKSFSPAYVFPFRLEALPAFEWAAKRNRPGLPGNDWKSNYYLALLLRHLGKTERALQLLRDCGDTPKFAAFYALRADWLPETAFEDVSRAVELDSGQWRYGVRLARLYQERGEYDKMLETTLSYWKRSPANDPLELLHAQALIANKKYAEAVTLLQRAIILPNEGGLAGRNIYREATLLRAVECLRKHDPDGAKKWVKAARLWPETLGSGKPYPENVDERLEDWLESVCDNRLGDGTENAAAPAPGDVPVLEDVLKITGASQTALVQKILEEWQRPEEPEPPAPEEPAADGTEETTEPQGETAEPVEQDPQPETPQPEPAA